MAIVFNEDLVLWCACVLQPTNSGEIAKQVKTLFPDIADSVDAPAVSHALLSLEQRGLLLCVHRKGSLYSGTAAANRRLSEKLRLARDSARLFLIHRRHGDSVARSGESVIQELDGDSPPNDERLAIEGAARPTNSAAEPRATRLPGRIRRPRINQQLESSVGSEIGSPDISLRYGSFANLRQIREASKNDSGKKDISMEELALCIGITPTLVRSMILRKRRYYRSFDIEKRSGGFRRIDAPRVFLKAVQEWIADYLLSRLPVHDACHSYRRGHSIITNTKPHIGRKFVGCLDIENFFGSIQKRDLLNMLTEAHFWPKLAGVMSSLCTFNGSLSQGAPTSPVLSNSYLRKYDEAVSVFAAARAVSYTRYADDIGFSGDERAAVLQCMAYATESLADFHLQARKDKSRVISQQGQQRITGVVVNKSGYPPRRFRRQVRAAFHHAHESGIVSKDDYNRLNGWLSYLRQFEGLRESVETKKYANVLASLVIVKNAE